MSKRNWLVLCFVLVAAGCSDSGSTAALLRVDTVDAGTECASGGQRIATGLDEDGDGVLDDEEIASEALVCNGEAGTDGSSGSNGASVLLAFADEPAGTSCATGGQRVTTGLDDDGDGVLDPSEVTDSAYLCAPVDPSGAIAGFRLVSKLTGIGGPIAEIVAASADGMLLAYTRSSDQSVGFVDLTDPLAPIELGTVSIADAVSHAGAGEATPVALTPNGQYALAAVKDTTDPIANADAGSLVFIDVATRTIAGSVAIGVGPDSIAITPDGTRAVIAIEDEEDEDLNATEQARPGSVQIVTLDYAMPASSTVTTVAITPDVGNVQGDPQPEYVDITSDGATAIVSIQESNVIAVLDLASATVTRYIDAGVSTHAATDVADDGEIAFATPIAAFLEPDSVCLLSDDLHFVTANEGDTPHEDLEPGVLAGGRGFSVFHIDGDRVYDSGESLELEAVRSGAYPDGRSDNRGIEPEGCATGVFSAGPGTPDREFAFILGERNASLFVVDVANPTAPVVRQVLAAPMRPEGVLAIPNRGLVAVSGEGDGVGGGIWIYQSVVQATDLGYADDVFEARSEGAPFGALGALAYDAHTGRIVATPDNAFLRNRIWTFRTNEASRRMELVRELLLEDHLGAPLEGYDPEGIALNPEGGFIVASEGIAGNGGSLACEGSVLSNRLLFVDPEGRLDAGYGTDGIVDLPCGGETNAIDWTTVRGNGYEGIAAVDSLPMASGGVQVYVAMQRALVGEGQNTRIGRYDVDSGTWDFWFYTLDPNPGGDAGNTFLSELIHVSGDRFAVVERDQGWAGEATNKTIRVFTLSSGTAGDLADPVDKQTAYDLLAHPFRFDDEKIEGLALGGGALWVTNDNDGGEALNLFLRLDPVLLY